MARRQLSVGKAIDDMTECSICTEVFTDPRGLPCYHTFCLKCLQTYCEDKRSGHRVPCPMCRKEFSIPRDGLSGLQKNFYIEKLLHVRKISAARPVQELSSDALRSLVVSDTEQVTDFVAVTEVVLQRLETEKNDVIKHLAGIEDEINTAADKLIAAIKRDKAKLVSEVGSLRVKQVKQLETVKQEVEQHRTALESFVKDSETFLSSGTAYDVRSANSLHNRADELMKFDVIGHVDSSLPPMDVSFTSSKLLDRDGSNLVGTVTEQDSNLNSPIVGCGQVDSSLSPLNETSSSRTTLTGSRAERDAVGTITEEDSNSSSRTTLPGSRAERDAAGTITEEDSNSSSSRTTLPGSRAERGVVGTVAEKDSNSSSPTVTHVIPAGGRNNISGVTSLGDDVFVLRYPNQQTIEVYDAKTFKLWRRITVPGLDGDSYGLAACPHNNCLYASDHGNNSVHRVELSGSNAVKKWSVARSPVGLSVNSEHNLLVVSQAERKLQIFTTHGKRLQKIPLQAGIERPWHAVQLPAGQFLVSHYGSLHGVCLVGVDGYVVRSYGGRHGYQLTQTHYPAALAVDREGRVLVADRWNNRLLVIDQSLSSAHEMSVRAPVGLYAPCSLWYDQSRRRLYIGEGNQNEGRVIVIDNLKDFSTVHVGSRL